MRSRQPLASRQLIDFVTSILYHSIIASGHCLPAHHMHKHHLHCIQLRNADASILGPPGDAELRSWWGSRTLNTHEPLPRGV